MKKLFLTLVIALVAMVAQSQNVSYANLMKLSKMKSVGDISTTLRSRGYKLGHTESTDEYETYEWGWGTARYEEYLDDWTSSGTRWGLFTYMKYHNVGGIMYFTFFSTATYNQVKAQVKANGWKLMEEYADQAGFSSRYNKNGTDNFITLTELTSEAGGYLFRYSWYGTGNR